MKKLYLLLIVLLLAACQRDEEAAAPDVSQQITQLHDYLKADLYAKARGATFQPVQVHARAAEVSHINTGLTKAQLAIAEPFIQTVWNTETTTGLSKLVDGYEAKVLQSRLTEREKWELITIGEAVRVTGEFIDEGGFNIVYNNVSGNLRTSNTKPGPKAGDDPCINTKEIMQGAVFSGFAGAAYGGFIGATAGTFTVPIIGTATGAVGGAVFGFAEGFFGGVVGGAAQQIIFDCLLKREDGSYQTTLPNGDKLIIPKDFGKDLTLYPK